MDFTLAFKIAGLAEKVGAKIHSALKSAKGHKRKLLLELQDNIDVAFLWKEKDFAVDKIILKFERKHYDSALADNFNFSSITSTKLSQKTIRGVPQFNKYVGWSTEKLIDNLYRKIKQIRNIAELDIDNTKININVRMGNIYKMMILITHHIKS